MTKTIRRRIISIDAEKCNGCEACTTACHEGAIVMRDGKAVLLRDDYCDGLGDCLPACPTGAITFVERETLPYDEAAVIANQAVNQGVNQGDSNKKIPHPGCPGCAIQEMQGLPLAPKTGLKTAPESQTSCLRQWPVQLRLVPANAPFLKKASLLIAADCTAFALASFHREFMQGKITLIGCPKLDDVDYAAKLLPILDSNNIQDITVAKMSVPCCTEIARATVRAIEASGRDVPLKVVTIAPDGKIEMA